MGAHLQRGDHFVAVVLGGDGIPHDAVGVDDRVPLLPADDDGPLSPRRAVELLGVALDGDGGVGVGGDRSLLNRSFFQKSAFIIIAASNPPLL